MARAILTALLIVLLNVFVGCGGIDSGRAQLLPTGAKTALGPAAAVRVSDAGETDIVEEIAVSRQRYRQGLEILQEHYTKTGNNMKLQWAKEELKALNRMPQYNYIIEAGVAGPNLRASTAIPEAEYLYNDAMRLEKRAKRFVIIADNNLLRLALDEYNRLIRKHPSSDKIDDAAYRAAGIYEHFEDYTIAVLYYQRTYQWDRDTIYPARFKAAYVLDQKLHRRAEALQLYQQFVKTPKWKTQNKKRREFVEKRIKDLSKIDRIAK